jgi:hypothetical protein
MQNDNCWEISIVKRVLSIIVLVAVLGLAVAFAGTVVGTYVNKDNLNEYVVLKSDGKFHLREDGKDYFGVYILKGNEIVFLFKSGSGFAGTIHGRRIIDENDSVWVKQ